MEKYEHKVRISKTSGFEGKIFVAHRQTKKKLKEKYEDFYMKAAESMFIRGESKEGKMAPVILTVYSDDIDFIFFKSYIEKTAKAQVEPETEPGTEPGVESDDFSGSGWQLTVRNPAKQTLDQLEEINVSVGNPVIAPDPSGQEPV